MLRSLQSLGVRRGVWMDRTASHNDVLALIADLRPELGPRALVRFGGQDDGGYLIPDDLEGIGGCISPGVSEECSFDLMLASLGIPVYMADASVSSPPISHDLFSFTKKFLDIFNSETTVTLDKFVEKSCPGSDDLILQMDIEGAEWRVLSSASEETMKRFRIMVFEFHDLASLFSRCGFRELSSVFRKILLTHAVVHIHPNNVSQPIKVNGIVIPNLMEFTFLRRDRGPFVRKERDYPAALDRKNVKNRPDIILPEYWR